MEDARSEALELLRKAGEDGQLGPLILQLRKDYARANLPFPLGEGEAWEALPPGRVFQDLRENLYVLLMERFDQYLNLMYAADVPERQFREVLPTDAVEVSAQLTLLLLRREWQKIRLRQEYGREEPGD